MAIKTVCECDTCDAVIDVTEGNHPACINASAPTPTGIGKQSEESHLCNTCWEKLCALFPRFKEAERFTQPVPVPEPVPSMPPHLDTVSAEELLVVLATKLGVKVKKTDE